HWFAAAYTALLLVWHFPANERFLLPLFPLLLAALATEAQHLAAGIQAAWKKDAANRAVAAGVCAALAALVCAGLALDFDAVYKQIPEAIEQHRMVLASNRAAFAWIAQHAPDASFYAYDDPVFYLYTGQHAASMPV